MKALIALLALAAMASTANAREPLTDTIDVYVYNAAQNTGRHIGQVGTDIADFARENDCRHNGNNTRCIYQMPLEGLAEPVVIGTGRVGGELVVLVTDVPTRMIDFVSASFDRCADASLLKPGELICRGFAITFDAAGDIIYTVGHYGAASTNMTARSVAQVFELGSSAITNMTTRGQFGEGVKDLVAAGILTPGCLLASPFALVLTGNGINCDEWVAEERATNMD